MKLATLKDGSRDGRLVLVDKTLGRCLAVPDVAGTMQQLLDDWERRAPVLSSRYAQLNAGQAAGAERFAAESAMAPLPRAFQWCDGSAYLSHAELVRKARKAEMPDFLYREPMMYQGGSDTFLGACDDIWIADEAWGIDLEAEVAVVTADVPMGVTPAEAGQYIRLVTIVNDVSLRNLIPHELSKGFGFFQSKPSTAFAPVVVTPDELVPHWDGGKLSLPLISAVNGVELGRPNAGVDLDFEFPALIAHAARSRHLAAGTVVGSGTVSNRDRAVGSSCLAEKRMLETIHEGAATTPFLRFGDMVEIDMRDDQGMSVFGKIAQTVRAYQR